MPRIKKGEIRKSKRYNFACTPEMIEKIHTVSAALNLSPSEFLRKLVTDEYNVLIQNRAENLKLEGDENA